MLLNAFSLNMVSAFPVAVRVMEVSVEEARDYLLLEAEAEGETDILSAVGHADTAAVFAAVLGVPVQCNRVTVSMQLGDIAIVGQYSGPRLPEGCKTLPDGASIKWLFVEVA